jgi:hypothetical protein
MAIRRDDNKYTSLSLAQYDGQARNGEIVIDLDTYSVWVGDSTGTLLPVSGGNGSSYTNANANAFLANGQVGNIIPDGNAVNSLGNITNQWRDLWVSNATIYFNSVPLSAINNTLTFAGEPLLVSGGNSNIVTTGTIEVGGLTSDGNVVANAGYFFIGDGGLISNISGGGGGYGNGDVALFLPTYTGNLGNVTNITLSGTITGNGVGLSNIAGANVTGQVANALVSGTVYANTQSNITSVGTLTTLDVTGNITLGSGSFFIGDGGELSNIQGANVVGEVANATFATTAGAADSTRYRQIGNAVAVPVVEWIIQGILDSQ